MLDIEELNEDNIAVYASLMGEDISADMGREFYRGYGVVDDNGSPVGAMVYELINAEKADENVKSRILQLKAENDEIFDIMQKKYKEEGVEEEDITQSFYWLKEERSAASCEKAGFTKELKESEFLTLTVQQATGIPYFSKIKRFPDYICSLKEVTPSQYRLAIKNCLFRGAKGILEDLGYLRQEWFDNVLSVCTITDDEISGLFLVRTTATGIIEPVFLHAVGPDSQKHMAMMIAYSVDQAMHRRKPDSVIRIRRSREATMALVSRLFPGLKGEEIFFGNRQE